MPPPRWMLPTIASRSRASSQLARSPTALPPFVAYATLHQPLRCSKTTSACPQSAARLPITPRVTGPMRRPNSLRPAIVSAVATPRRRAARSNTSIAHPPGGPCSQEAVTSPSSAAACSPAALAPVERCALIVAVPMYMMNAISRRSISPALGMCRRPTWAKAPCLPWDIVICNFLYSTLVRYNATLSCCAKIMLFKSPRVLSYHSVSFMPRAPL